MLFNILALISLLFVIIILKRFASILPVVTSCVFRWKENINIDTSLRLRTERDLTAASMLLPFCLLSAKLKLYSPDFVTGMSENAVLGITSGVFIGYILMRAALIAAIRPKRMPSGIYHAATSTEHTFFILLTCSLLITVGITSLLDASSEVTRHAMFWISGAIYMIFLIRKMQIFTSCCNLFVSFLYLCALEILPTGVLIASAVIF
jgi:hypothetical protein